MTVRGEIAKSPCETGARRREGGEADRQTDRQTDRLVQSVDRPSGEPACGQACRGGVSAVAVEAFVNYAG
ncbi:MAG: hypothetical protein EWM73_02271 [Nitrospira sp.]|nr:MAG: hypothetical protein EWM73_02271 [Nitrospira sp.]